MVARYAYHPREVPASTVPHNEQLAFGKGDTLFVNFNVNGRSDGWSSPEEGKKGNEK